MNILIILSITFYVFSGILDAVMDTLKDHFSISIFSKLNPQFWNPSISWTNKYINNDHNNGHKTFSLFGITFPTLDALSDAWHISKILREGFNILAILSALFSGAIFNFYIFIEMLVFLIVLRDLAFNLFYTKLLLK